MADDAEPQRADLSGAGTATSSPSAAPLARPEPAWPRATTVRATRFALQRDRTARAGAPRPLHPGKAAARRQSPARAGLEPAAGPHGRLWLPALAGGTLADRAAGGAEQWFSYVLIAAGWLLATTIAAGVARVLSRN